MFINPFLFSDPVSNMFILSALYIERRLAVVSFYNNVPVFIINTNSHFICDLLFKCESSGLWM